MDPITLILSALAAGATAAAKDTAGTAVKDLYQGLKALLLHLFSGKSEATTALGNCEQKPDVWKEPVKDALTQTGAGQNEAIIKAAQALMANVDPQGAAQGKFNVNQGKFNVNIGGSVQGMVAGDHIQVSMTFNDPPK